MLSWSYYGAKSWTYLFGESRSMDLLFKLIFCIFVVIGSSVALGPVVDLSDSAIFAMSIANIIGLYILFPVVKRDLESYWSRLQAGQLKRYRTTWLIHVD
jgi:AGCS family alanine or glycine:cation symporter